MAGFGGWTIEILHPAGSLGPWQCCILTAGATAEFPAGCSSTKLVWFSFLDWQLWAQATDCDLTVFKGIVLNSLEVLSFSYSGK